MKIVLATNVFKFVKVSFQEDFHESLQDGDTYKQVNKQRHPSHIVRCWFVYEFWHLFIILELPEVLGYNTRVPQVESVITVLVPVVVRLMQ